MINKGTIVKFKEGFYRVTSLRGDKVNLGSIWGGRIIYKGIEVDLVIEAESEFYDYWSKSETYLSM